MNNLLNQRTQTVYAPGGGSGGVVGAKSADGGNVAVAAADTSKAIVFGASFSSAPAVNGKLMSPTGATEIAAKVDYSTLTSTGVTFRFSAIPASGWFLSWEAVGS